MRGVRQQGERTNGTGVADLEPAVEAVRVEGVGAGAPGNGAVDGGLAGAVDAGHHNDVAADGARVRVQVPLPQSCADAR